MQQRQMMECVALVVVVVVVCLGPGALGQQAGGEKQTFIWSVQGYPDPFSYDTYTKCGRQNRSNICDPNKLMSKEQADKVDSLISRVFRETRCTCSKCFNNAHGYVIRVAVMPRMQNVYKDGKNSTEDLLKNAQMFAYMLTQKWAMGGSCNESVLILFSRYDGVLYTLTLPLAREVLKDHHVKRITMAVRHLFDDNDTIGDGLFEMIRRYK
ncbi:uncharacterized protein LOC143282663 isoform X2 [Babylonia areolata]